MISDDRRCATRPTYCVSSPGRSLSIPCGGGHWRAARAPRRLHSRARRFPPRPTTLDVSPVAARYVISVPDTSPSQRPRATRRVVVVKQRQLDRQRPSADPAAYGPAAEAAARERNDRPTDGHLTDDCRGKTRVAGRPTARPPADRRRLAAETGTTQHTEWDQTAAKTHVRALHCRITLYARCPERITLRSEIAASQPNLVKWHRTISYILSAILPNLFYKYFKIVGVIDLDRWCMRIALKVKIDNAISFWIF